jgi:molecular chaperone HscB
MDHFARLGLPAALDLEPASLDRAYFALQRQWHPDRFANRPPEERVRASAEAAALNDAYRTLKDPLSRAVHLAELAAKAREDMKSSLVGLGSLFLRDDKPAIRKTLLRLRYLDKFSEEARARRANLERSSA